MNHKLNAFPQPDNKLVGFVQNIKHNGDLNRMLPYGRKRISKGHSTNPLHMEI